jgi:hypothetical protein
LFIYTGVVDVSDPTAVPVSQTKIGTEGAVSKVIVTVLRLAARQDPPRLIPEEGIVKVT